MNDFIFELGCEELPSGAVWPLADELTNQFLGSLDKAQLKYGEVQRFATPRRLAIILTDLQSEQANQSTTRRGPAALAAFDKDGNATPALLGFAKSCGVDVSQLSRIETDKGDWMVFESQTQGSQTKDLLPALITQSLASLTIAKPMRWGAGLTEFARPVHWAVMIYGDECIEHGLLGVKTSRESRGHRFHHPQNLTIQSAKTYELQMKEAFVVADFSKRRDLIKQQVMQLATSCQAEAIMPEALLDEVTSIVEWPVALLAHFDNAFLEVPAEALIASMQAHQKCFALKDKEGKLLPHFITVSNISSLNPQQVIAGNEKVMRARLSDAVFFFRQDKKQSLSNHLQATEQVVFQLKLGSLYDKSLRVKALMASLSQALSLPLALAQRAAELSKCDLMTGMVGEFPELQGLMGYYYALNDQEDPQVAVALDEQYRPRFSADLLPESDLGLALSLADRIDSLVGIFAIGQKPSGVKDPFKLRRHALAVARLLISTSAKINLTTLIEESQSLFHERIVSDKALIAELKPFILDRLQSYYLSQGVTPEMVLAVRARQDDWFYDMDKRLNALKVFVTLPQAAALSAACKRVSNLLSQSGTTGADQLINEDQLEEGAERALFESLNAITKSVAPLYREAKYTELLTQLALLREPIDAFFDQVMVMVDNEAVKRNRLALLANLQSLLQGVADISMLQIG